MRKRLKRGVLERLAYEKERYRLIANISHDLMTPITSIKGYVEGMRDGVASTPEMRERYLNTIYDKACLMERLIEQMSDFSELELGRMRFHFESCIASDFLSEICEEFRIDLESEGAMFEVDVSKAGIAVDIDREKLRRVFLNLLSNSVKYRSDRPLEVRISAQAAERGVLISVRDNGRGISKDDIDRVFEGFYRADPARSGSTRGHGLGLTIAEQIIENHRGKIWIKSEENAGTEVNIHLPASRKGVQSS
jgi:histidine kinase